MSMRMCCIEVLHRLDASRFYRASSGRVSVLPCVQVLLMEVVLMDAGVSSVTNLSHGTPSAVCP